MLKLWAARRQKSMAIHYATSAVGMAAGDVSAIIAYRWNHAGLPIR